MCLLENAALKDNTTQMGFRNVFETQKHIKYE